MDGMSLERTSMPDEKFLCESIAMQSMMAAKVVREDSAPFSGELVTGIDVTYRDDIAYACAIVMHIPTQSIVKNESLVMECEYPYIPGHFYLREGPVILKLLENLQDTGPLLIDGNGILHPRRLGLASYIGVNLDRQTIGVAKSLLLGLVGKREDNIASIIDDDEEIGAAIWIGNRAKPVYVSIGNKVSLRIAIEVTLAASFGNYPEPLRQAHICTKSISR